MAVAMFCSFCCCMILMGILNEIVDRKIKKRAEVIRTTLNKLNADKWSARQIEWSSSNCGAYVALKILSITQPRQAQYQAANTRNAYTRPNAIARPGKLVLSPVPMSQRFEARPAGNYGANNVKSGTVEIQNIYAPPKPQAQADPIQEAVLNPLRADSKMKNVGNTKGLDDFEKPAPYYPEIAKQDGVDPFNDIQI